MARAERVAQHPEYLGGAGRRHQRQRPAGQPQPATRRERRRDQRGAEHPGRHHSPQQRHLLPGPARGVQAHAEQQRGRHREHAPGNAAPPGGSAVGSDLGRPLLIRGRGRPLLIRARVGIGTGRRDRHAEGDQAEQQPGGQAQPRPGHRRDHRRHHPLGGGDGGDQPDLAPPERDVLDQQADHVGGPGRRQQAEHGRGQPRRTGQHGGRRNHEHQADQHDPAQCGVRPDGLARRRRAQGRDRPADRGPEAAENG